MSGQPWKEVLRAITSNGGGGNSNEDNKISKQERKAREKAEKKSVPALQNKAREKRYPVVNIETGGDLNVDSPLIELREVGDYNSILLDANPGKKKKSEHLGKFSPEEKKEKKYIRSGEYMEHLKSKVFMDPGHARMAEKTLDYLGKKTFTKELVEKLFSGYPDESTGTSNNDIIKKRNMPGKNELKSNVVVEKKAPNAEDLKLQNEIYREADYWRDILKRKSGDKKRDERNMREMETFERSPYGWMKEALTNAINKNKALLSGTTDTRERQRIDEKIRINTESLNNIDHAFEKNLPLKLDRKFTPNEMPLGKDTIFKVGDWTKEINDYVDGKSSKYSIEGVVQRRNDDFIVLKNDKGETVEINLWDLADGVRENLPGKNEGGKEKQSKFEEIKKGSVVKVRTGGVKGPVTTYEILDIKDGKVFFKNLTKKHGGSMNMSIEGMQAFLSGSGTEFLVEEKKVFEKAKDPVVENKTIPKPKQTVPETKPVVIGSVDDVKRIDNDLGYVNAAVLTRELKIDRNKAEELYREYMAGKPNEATDNKTKKKPGKGKVEKTPETKTATTEEKTDKKEEKKKAEKKEKIVGLSEEKMTEILGYTKSVMEKWKAEKAQDDIERQKEEAEEKQDDAERQKELYEIKAGEEKLAELMKLREKLVAEEGLKEKPEENINIRERLADNIALLKANKKRAEDELANTSGLRLLKVLGLNKSIKRARVELLRMEKMDLELDKKEKPLLYYAASRITNDYVLQELRNKDLGEVIDLRRLKNTNEYECKTKYLHGTRENEGFYEFNPFGFVKVIKNVKEIRDDKGVNIDSEDAIYKILSPDFKVIANDIKGYTEATRLYNQATEQYKMRVEERFNQLNKK
ncbi:MAG: hypothetical protein AAB477_00200 [Patescibacteria group bacterium]